MKNKNKTLYEYKEYYGGPIPRCPRFLLPKEAVLCPKKRNIYGSIILLLRCAIKN